MPPADAAIGSAPCTPQALLGPSVGFSGDAADADLLAGMAEGGGNKIGQDPQETMSGWKKRVPGAQERDYIKGERASMTGEGVSITGEGVRHENNESKSYDCGAGSQ